MINAIERKALDNIDFDGLLHFLCNLIEIQTLSGEESEGQEYVAAHMKDCGLDVDLWDLDISALKEHPSFSMEVEREIGVGVVGVMGKNSGGRDLILNGHIDVVPAGDAEGWNFPPWQGTIRENRVYGRGAVDMKGGLACTIFAAKALRDADIDLAGRLILQSVIGEEDGGVGTLATILRGYTADGAIVLEPTELAVSPAQAGALSFRVTVHGLSAHGCVREEGVSAIDKFAQIYDAIISLETKRNGSDKDPLFGRYRLPYPISVGKIRAGNWPSTVPEELVFEGRYGVAVGENLKNAKNMLEAAISRVAREDSWMKKNPPLLEWWGGQFDSAMIANSHPIVETVTGAFLDCSGSSPRLEGMTYGADMRLLVNVGKTPTVLFGPGDVRNSHRPDEFVPLDELKTAARTLVLSAIRFCGIEGRDGLFDGV